MHIFKRAHFRGMLHELQRRGYVTLPSEKIAEEVADAVADEYEDEVIPPVTDESGLTEDEAAEAVNKLVEVAEVIAEKSGAAVDPAYQQKVASVTTDEMYKEAASQAAISLIEKAALEGPIIPGQKPPEDGLDATNEAQVDATDNPSAEVIVPKGESSMDATPGAVGHEAIRPDQPGANDGDTPVEVADVKVSSVDALLAKLGMGASTMAAPSPAGDGSPGAAGGKGDGRKDLETNLGMGKDMIVPQGDTKQTPPAVPVPLKSAPAAAGVDITQKDKPQTDVQADISKAASLLLKTERGRAILKKIGEELKEDEEEEKKKDDEEKAAAEILRRALGHASQAVS